MTPELVKAIGITYELCGSVQLSETAGQAAIQSLSKYPEHSVLEALNRCVTEVSGRLSLRDIIERIDDGRPGPEEAFAMLPQSESDSVVWNDEIAEAAQMTYNATDRVSARMAFKESYLKIIAAARTQGKTISWYLSAGTDPRGRERAITEAVAKKRITGEKARFLLPSFEAPEQQKNNRLAENRLKQLMGETQKGG